MDLCFDRLLITKFAVSLERRLMPWTLSKTDLRVVWQSNQ